MDAQIDTSRLEFLARLPTLLNSSLETKDVVGKALQHVKARLSAEAATIFLLNSSNKELSFWALDQESGEGLEGQKLPADKGIVGWVIQNQEPVLVTDASKDPRFYQGFDEKGSFVTRDVICIPLTIRGRRKVGALQLLNKSGDEVFTQQDLDFAEQFAHQTALAIDNALLFSVAKERNKRLETLNKRRKELLTVITHEFRTPLNIIQSSAELLASGIVAEEVMDELAETMTRGVNRLTRLVSEIRNASVSSAELVEINRSNFDTSKLVKSLEQQYTPICAGRNITLRVNDDGSEKTICADRSLLTVALKNLLSNAIRFTPDEGEISIDISSSNGLIEFKVSDTGIGIPAEEHTIIFEKFYEVADALHHSSGTYEFKSAGLGIGLATVKAIVEAHESEVKVSSTLGEGSAFSFSLPAL